MVNADGRPGESGGSPDQPKRAKKRRAKRKTTGRSRQTLLSKLRDKRAIIEAEIEVLERGEREEQKAAMIGPLVCAAMNCDAQFRSQILTRFKDDLCDPDQIELFDLETHPINPSGVGARSSTG